MPSTGKTAPSVLGGIGGASDFGSHCSADRRGGAATTTAPVFGAMRQVMINEPVAAARSTNLLGG
jgi:hypothetical protein